MNPLLLDTCAVIHISMGSPVLTQEVISRLQGADEVFVSAMSASELACLCQRGRLDLGMHWKPWFRKAVALNGWQVLPLTLEIMEEAYSLPEVFHQDPADRMLVATARKHNLTLLTTDRKILEYPHVDAAWG